MMLCFCEKDNEQTGNPWKVEEIYLFFGEGGTRMPWGWSRLLGMVETVGDGRDRWGGAK